MKKLVILILIANLANCNSIRRKFHYFMDMAYSPAVDTQRVDEVATEQTGKQRVGNRVPPDNTIAYKFLNPRYDRTIPGNYVLDGNYIAYNINGTFISNVPEDHEVGSHLIHNPLPNNAETLARGKERFNIYCSPCHGFGGKGDGKVKAKFPTIKAIARPTPNEPVRAEQWSVERIFLVTTTGINAMNSYATQVPEKDRWAIARYVKELQREAMK